MAKTRKVRWAVVQAETDAIQYKSYKPVMAPVGPLFVEVEVQDTEVLEIGNGGETVVSPAGLAKMLGDFAHAMYRDNEDRKVKVSRRRDD